MTDEYNTILNELIETIGGKELCLRQMLPESVYRTFIKKYREDNKEKIMNLINSNTKIIDADINSANWIKYFMKIFYYDSEKQVIYEYDIKMEKVTIEEIVLNGVSSFSKFKNGYMLEDLYKSHINVSEKQ
jgi:hypothetical protein